MIPCLFAVLSLAAIRFWRNWHIAGIMVERTYPKANLCTLQKPLECWCASDGVIVSKFILYVKNSGADRCNGLPLVLFNLAFRCRQVPVLSSIPQKYVYLPLFRKTFVWQEANTGLMLRFHVSGFQSRSPSFYTNSQSK